MTSSRKLKTAIVGYGISGKLSHAYGITANPEFEIVAVCDLSPERRADAEAEHGCPTFCDHPSLMAAVPELDLACVITRSDTHCAIASDFLAAGVSALVTKPWVLNESEAQTLIEAQRRGGAQLFPWVPVYWADEVRQARQLIADGSIGNVFMVRRQIGDFRRREDWQTQRRFGGGYLLNWGAHIVPPLLALAGSPLVRVNGKLQEGIVNPGDADDAFFAMLEFENGCLGIAEFAQACEGLPTLMVQGDRGMLHSDGKTLTLLQKDPGDPAPPRRTSFPIAGKAFGDEAEIYRDVAQTLLFGRPFAVTPEDALLQTRVFDAIRASHENHKSVGIPTRFPC